MDIGKQLMTLLPADRIRTRYIDRVTFGSDAGFYYLLPKAVVHPVSEAEIVALFAFSHRHGIPLVFRAGGTSLSGQSVTDGILVDLSRQWNMVDPQEEGRMVRVGPGVTGAMVNARLRTFHRKIGPDPSSIASAKMGGILSNNSSGMCCGVGYNSYHTLKHIRFILPGGATFDTADPADYGRFAADPTGIASELSKLRAAILADEDLRGKIRRKYRAKNTVGYSLNAFIDYEHPLDIFAHLLIGAEGTLAFIASASLQTIPQLPYKSTGLLYFADLHAACDSIPALVGAGAEAVELMDRASLRAVENIPGMPAVLKMLPPSAAALLVEFHGETRDRLQERLRRFMETAPAMSTLHDAQFTGDPAEQELLWNVRKGLFPSVGAVRKSGTTVILEDIAFPVHRLADAVTDLQTLFAEFGYDNAIIFGHAKDGNIHFVITQSFGPQTEIDRYAKFIDRLVPLVVDKYDGALKAEHGTGRNMAPFVETEWGPAAYQIMQRLKAAVDPLNLLNPGVIISPDERLHLKNLKQMPQIEPEVDKCIECGYCEPVCPSRDLTMTPRRRIVARRALKLLQAAGDTARRSELVREFRYDGLETCAVDGLCAGACPVEINTGDLVKRLRRENHSAAANSAAMFIARNFAPAERLARFGLSCGAAVNRLFGNRAMTHLTHMLRKMVAAAPLWPAHLRGAPTLPGPVTASSDRRIVYVPSCVTRMLQLRPGANTMDTLLGVAGRCGIGVILPQNIHGTCCGQVFSSKGFAAAYRYTANRIVASLWDLTQNGTLPVVMDVSSCTYTLLNCREHLEPENRKRFGAIQILDVVDFLHDMIMPLATHIRPTAKVMLHPVCSLHKMHNYAKFLAVARHFAAGVTIPQRAGCCGMAGDRGFLFPELTAAAAAEEAAEVKTATADGYYSSAVSCELAMSEATGKAYSSIIRLAAEALFVS
ncbi:MAG TPA: FAD-binding and (Fe-S)-binding domain-containing protein [Puia sp.]|nr:FAD-binding and (Fe-S)-binding domain-containing protein [Puia sp.]